MTLASSYVRKLVYFGFDLHGAISESFEHSQSCFVFILLQQIIDGVEESLR